MIEATPSQDQTVASRNQGVGLALVRFTIGAMFVSVFFENLGKGAYTPAGYAGVINYYIQHGHAPAVWKAIMGVLAGAPPWRGQHKRCWKSHLGSCLYWGCSRARSG